MVVVVVMLAAAVLFDSVPTDCWQGSISAYYYTAAHNVFVAALCCLGIMMIVYKGSKDSEDVLLNLAGTLAFFVAFVPIKLQSIPLASRSCRRPTTSGTQSETTSAL